MYIYIVSMQCRIRDRGTKNIIAHDCTGARVGGVSVGPFSFFFFSLLSLVFFCARTGEYFLGDRDGPECSALVCSPASRAPLLRERGSS